MTDQEPATRQCPFCREKVKLDAVRCKHCQAAIVSAETGHGGVCPFCKEDINPEAIRCMHCKADLGPAGSRTCCQERSAADPAQIRQMTFPATSRVRRVVDPRNRMASTPCYMEGSTMWCLDYDNGDIQIWVQAGYV
jgi:predicted amidophosphoribosyltransferase